MIRPLKLKKDKRGGFVDLFVFIIFAFIIILICVIFVYIGNKTQDQLQETLGNMDLHDTEGRNASQVIDATMGTVNTSFSALYWISILIIGGMILGIFIGSYLVTTKPIFFVPYVFLTIIAIVVSVPVSNAYETLSNNATLSGTFAGFTGANWIMLNLPIWVTIIGFAGAIIMFSRMGKKEEIYHGY